LTAGPKREWKRAGLNWESQPASFANDWSSTSTIFWLFDLHEMRIGPSWIPTEVQAFL
jgi:hypothetical protein